MTRKPRPYGAGRDRLLYHVRVSAEELEILEAAFALSGLRSRSDWIRRVLTLAAHRALDRERRS